LFREKRAENALKQTATTVSPLFIINKY